VLGALVAVGCSDAGDDARTPTTGASATSVADGTAPTTTATPSPAAELFAAVCAGSPRILDEGPVPDELAELSGLVSGRRDPSLWWAHNDSGDAARVYALVADGAGTVELAATLQLTDADGDTIDAVDWEDMAIGPALDGDGASLYLGDIGDNAGSRRNIVVHRVVEPSIGDATAIDVVADTLTFTYPDGPHDAEALLVDPVDGDLWIVTKDWSLAGGSQLYRAPGDLAAGSTTELQHVATLSLPAATLVTAADVSPDGSVVALRAYGSVTLYERPEGQPLAAAFDSVPCEGPVPTERQGEAVAFAPDGGSYVTVSEGAGSELHRTVGG
jgi:hypothetical protein